MCREARGQLSIACYLEKHKGRKENVEVWSYFALIACEQTTHCSFGNGGDQDGCSPVDIQ